MGKRARLLLLLGALVGCGGDRYSADDIEDELTSKPYWEHVFKSNGQAIRSPGQRLVD